MTPERRYLCQELCNAGCAHYTKDPQKPQIIKRRCIMDATKEAVFKEEA
jgi:hypothetical protein